MQRVVIGLSGGVDSSVAAYLLKEQGYEVVGLFMINWHDTTGTLEGDCPWHDDRVFAELVARRLDIPFHVVDLSEEYRRRVVDYMFAEYERGRTPNPDVLCNREIKFDVFLKEALRLGADFVATGHYCRRECVAAADGTEHYRLLAGVDGNKDQSYFLACLNQEQLSRIQFPLGGLTKQEVRAIAEENGFINARKHDSQDICFVPDGDYAAFLERYTGRHYPAGDFLDETGRVVGKHRGAVCYTLGQRKGLGLAMGAPVYVCGKDMEKNTVTVGPNEALFSSALRGNNWVWYPFPELTEPVRVTVKTRHSQTEQPGTVYPEADGFARVEFDVPQRAVTPGQAVVVYQGDLVVGGGTITEAIR